MTTAENPSYRGSRPRRSRSPFLSAGMDRLREAVERFADGEFGAKAAYTVAHSIGNDFHRRRDDRLVR